MIFMTVTLLIFVGGSKEVLFQHLHIVPILMHLAIDRAISIVESTIERAQWNSLPVLTYSEHLQANL